MVLAAGLLGAAFTSVGSAQPAPALQLSAAAAALPGAVLQPQGGVQFFTDEDAFHAALGVPLGLTIETFDGGRAVGPYPTDCTAPMNSESSDGCFSPGELVPGFSITSSSGGALTIFPTRFLGPGQSSRAVGATTFLDSTMVEFSPVVGAAAANVFAGTVAGLPVDVEIYDEAGGSLGTTVLQTAPTRDGSVFFGVISATPIGKIALNTQSSTSGELLNHLQFRAAGLTPPGLGKSFAPSGVAAGQTSTLTITLGNQGQPGQAILDADLSDHLPSGLLVAETPNAATSCVDGTVTALAGSDVVTLASGARIPGAGLCTITVDVMAANAGLYANTIAAGALQTDLGENVDPASATLTVISGLDNTFPPAENFDGVFAPQLPGGWVTSTTAGVDDWTTTTTASDSGPNSAFAPDRNSLSDMHLDSPAFTAVAGQNVSFRHHFSLERRFDGAVLEISINGGEFADILAAGGSFVTGGYGGVRMLSSGSALDGRPAWTGDSSGFVTTIATLPASAVGQPVKLRFRTADDAGSLNTDTPMGWWIDSIVLGISAQPPIGSVAPEALNVTLEPGETATATLTVGNAMGSDPLTFSVQSRSEMSQRGRLTPYTSLSRKMLAQDGKPLLPRPPATLGTLGSDGLDGSDGLAGASHAAASPWAPQGSLLFRLDDGSAESSNGNGVGSWNPPVPFTQYATVWTNRFSASDALTIHSISVFWPEPSMAGGDLHGLQANLVVYYDAQASGNPANAVRVGTDTLVPIFMTGNFQTYQTDFSIPAAGDVYIGFVDHWALAGGFMPRLYPAAIDTTSASLGRSYYSSVGSPPVDVDQLGNNDYNELLAGNLMVRAAAIGGGSGGACSGPTVNWLAATPSTGSVDGGAEATLIVTLDPAADGLAVGVYTAELCITTNDPVRSLIAVPISMTVGTPPPRPCNAGAEQIFCDGFDPTQGGSSIVSGTLDRPVSQSEDGSSFNFVTGSYQDYNPSITSDDIDLYQLEGGDGGEGLYVYWYGDAVPGNFTDLVGGVTDASGMDFAVLHSGDTVGPNSTIWNGSMRMNVWLGGVDGYVGIAFYNESTEALNYGYLHLTTTGPFGFPAQVLEWAYDSSGAAITIP